MQFNPLNYPICFDKPQRLTDINPWHEHIPFAFTIIQMAKPKTFVELGTYKGDSYCAFCQAVDILRLDTACYAIDIWKGDEHAGFYGNEILEELQAYHNPLYNNFSRLIQSWFDEALNHFSDGSIDLLHIDGCHTYEAVKYDFDYSLPKMSKCGIILFHDTNVHESGFGVWQLWQELKRKYPSFEFKHGHGLGVLAVGTEVSNEVMDFLEMGKQKAVSISNFYSYMGNKITLEHQLQKINIQINEFNSLLQSKDAKLKSLEDTLQDKNAKLKSLEGTLQDKDAKLKSLEDTLQDKDAKLKSLEDTLQDKDAKLKSLEDTLQDKDAKLKSLEDTLQDKDAKLKSLEDTLQDKDAKLKSLEDTLQKKNIQINEFDSNLRSIQQSVIWKAVTKYQKIIDTSLPHETLRRRTYDLGLLSIRTIVNEGWKSFLWKLKYYVRQKNLLNRRKAKIEKINVPRDSSTGIEDVIETKVSIIIPTKNAGNEFDYVLNKIKNQRRVKDLELIVVDSGSIDETLQIARKYEAKLYQIKPEDFGHGKTRNLGAKKATGEFILFTTQDAIFASKYLIYNMIKIMQSDTKIAAATCRQIPKSNADLMASFQVWNHYTKFLDINEDKIVSTKDLNIMPIEKRKLANLSDSCCCIRRDIFQKYLFRVDFAEDLDLGIRLLEKFKLAYLHSNAIIHSHNRNSSYFFKASYTDSKVVSEIIGNEPFCWNTNDINIFYDGIKKMYDKVIWAISVIENDDNYEPNNLFPIFKRLLCSETSTDRAIAYVGDINLNDLFNNIEILISYNESDQADKNIYNFLLNSYLGTLDTFSEYAINYATLHPIKTDFINTLYKLFSNSSGAALGNYILYTNGKHIRDKRIEELDRFLLGGV